MSDNTNVEAFKILLPATPNMDGLEIASKVSVNKPYFYGNENATYKISALNLGIKTNILRNLAARDCYIKVFPYNTPFKDLESFNPNGYFLSNDLGDPEPLDNAVQVAKQIIESKKPLFGITTNRQKILGQRATFSS